MIRIKALFGLCFLLALTGCLGSLVPIGDSSETDDALLGTWRRCRGTKIEVTRPDNWTSGGYAMKVTDRETHKAVTYRLFIQNIGGEEFADAFYAPRHVQVNDFPTVHVIAMIRHNGNDLLFRPMNEDWWKDENLEGSGLQVKEIGDYTAVILGKSSDLRTFLAAHVHDPEVFLGTDQDPNYGRLKRQWTAAEAEGCSEDL
jgi:hypothetical protein